MAFTAYPASADLTTFLNSAGFTAANGYTLGNFDLATAAAAGQRQFELDAGRIILADTVFSTRYYDPPTNPTASIYTDDFIEMATGNGCICSATISGGQLSTITVTAGGAGYPTLPPPLVLVTGGDPAVPGTAVAVVNSSGVVTAVNIGGAGANYQSAPRVNVLSGVVYQPYGATAYSYIPGRDYWMEPQNAPAKGRPYERIRFTYPRWAAGPGTGFRANALLVTAKWGYAKNLPEDVWNAMLCRASVELLPQLAQSSNQGVLEWQYDLDRAKNEPGFGTLRDQWMRKYRTTVDLYRKIV